MGLDFSKATIQMKNDIIIDETKEIEVLKYDIVEDKKILNEKLVNTKEVDEIVTKIDISNFNTLANFGSEVADEISKSSDIVLSQSSIYQVDKTRALLISLDKIMKRIDINEINKEPNVISNMFTSLSVALDKILNKYNTLGVEIDKIYVQLKLHENEILKANQLLKSMFDSNVKYYHDLIKYILAGEQACKELKEHIAKRENDLLKTGDQSIQFEISNLKQGLIVLEQRTQDLRATESIAMQSIPMINTMVYTNVNLVRKINSAFIITLPIFKQALAQAVLIKRQKLQTQMLEKLDKKTNEMLINNAESIVKLSQQTTEMSSTSSIKVETLEKTWKTIVDGIDETKKIQEESLKKCQEDAKRLEVIKDEFNKRFAD